MRQDRTLCGKTRLVAVFVAVLVATLPSAWGAQRNLDAMTGDNLRAWQEAVEVLKAEVGSPAVEAGVFFIPRSPVNVPKAATCWVRQVKPPWVHPGRDEGTRRTVYLHLDGTRSALLFEESFGRSDRWIPHSIEVAYISEDKARHAWKVLDHLTTVHVRTGSPWEKSTHRVMMSIGSRVWTSSNLYVKRGLPFGDPGPVDALREACAFRFLWGLRRDESLDFRTDRDTVDAMLMEVANGLFYEGIFSSGFHEVSKLLRLCLDESAAVSFDIFNEKRGNPASESSTHMHWIPFFSPDEPGYFHAQVKEHIRALKILAGKPPEAQIEFLVVTAFVGSEWTQRAYCAEQLLLRLYPETWLTEVKKAFPSFSKGRKRWTLVRCRQLFSDEVSLAHAAAQDDDGKVRFAGLAHLFKVTGDVVYLEKTASLATSADASWFWYAWRAMLKEKGDQRRSQAAAFARVIDSAYPGDDEAPPETFDEVGVLIRALENPDALPVPESASRVIVAALTLALERFDDPRVDEALLNRADNPASVDPALRLDALENASGRMRLAETGNETDLMFFRRRVAQGDRDSSWITPLVMIELRHADDPAAYLAELDAATIKILFKNFERPIASGDTIEKFTEEELEDLLARKSHAAIWPIIYGLLRSKRAAHGL